MRIIFYKYHGAGNDFIMIDNRQQQLPRYWPELYSAWCHRRFGIGADGVIMIQQHPTCNFEMVYYNADGQEGSMCGNGGRCVAAFARQLGIVQEKMFFMAADGPHSAIINMQTNEVSIQMSNVTRIERHGADWVLNTGSPHYVQFVNHLPQIDVFAEGRNIRNSAPFSKEGINVNFVEIQADENDNSTPPMLNVATYERGVEDETYACGTGVVAACITAYCHKKHIEPSNFLTNTNNDNNSPPPNKHIAYQVQTKGGRLSVTFNAQNDQEFSDIWLTGSAVCIFSGQIDITAAPPLVFD